ncbi:homeobox protein MSH-D-like [Haliotis rubra]|uniref:homeobox protein MSH-D-like n=1 Tax=Haliotis rubra TaxID=36100 RepID=UPI001EE63083|nr:homeobox protein MSH-D-like [Haliotis rubra]
MDSPKKNRVPVQEPVRCLFPQEQASIPNVNTQPVPVHPQVTRFSATDIINVPNTDDSLSSDDSGTDTLHIALDDSSSDDNPRDLSAGNNKHKDDTPDPHTQPVIARIPLVNQPMFAHSSPLISEYPRPAMSFYHAPPPASSFTSLHTQLPPVMFPSTFPGFLPYQPPVFSYLQSHAMTPQHPIETSRVLSTSDASDDEGNDSDSRGCSPQSSRDQTSPANSFTSSGVYSNPSPVPSPVPSPDPSPIPSVSETFDFAPSPFKTPVTNKRTRAPGGRTCYAPNHIRVMEKAFTENKYPDYDLLEKMSAELDIPVKKIKVWFQNKRARNKSRYPDMSTHNMAASMSAVGYGYLPGAMPLPFTSGPHMMPVYPGYPYPGMYPSPMC